MDVRYRAVILLLCIHTGFRPKKDSLSTLAPDFCTIRPARRRPEQQSHEQGQSKCNAGKKEKALLAQIQEGPRENNDSQSSSHVRHKD